MNKSTSAFSLICGLCFLFGIFYFVAVLGAGDFLNANTNAAANLAFIMDNAQALKIWYLVIYVLFGFSLLGLVVGVNTILGEQKSSWAAGAYALGIIWVAYVIAAGMIYATGIDELLRLFPEDAERALALWTSFQAIENGIGGHFELVSGAWVGFTGASLGQSKILPKWFVIVSITIAIAGFATLFTPVANDIFGLSSIVWFFLLAWFLFRSQRANV